jgi:hypothetical protein
VDFLNACHQLHPAAKRLLLITHYLRKYRHWPRRCTGDGAGTAR